MGVYDERLRALKEKLDRSGRLQCELDSLKRQLDGLEDKVRSLERSMRWEEADVTRLEARSLSRAFLLLTGRLDDRLDKERREACAAVLKYETARQELERTEQAYAERSREMQAYRETEREYRAAWEEKLNALRTAGIPEAETLLRLEESVVRLESRKKEIQEAVASCKNALRLSEAVLSALRSADGFATWDLLGGGLVTDAVKHSRLDEAQRYAEALQLELRRFSTELADVDMNGDMQVSVDGFLRFADYFFDGVLADWAVKEAIGRSRDGVERTQQALGRALARLDDYHRQTVREQAEARRRIERLVEEAPL